MEGGWTSRRNWNSGFKLDEKKTFFKLTAGRKWSKLSRQVVQTLVVSLNKALSNIVWYHSWVWCEQGLNLRLLSSLPAWIAPQFYDSVFPIQNFTTHSHLTMPKWWHYSSGWVLNVKIGFLAPALDIWDVDNWCSWTESFYHEQKEKGMTQIILC